MIGARTVGNDLALQHALALFHHWLLVDAGVLVRALELRELVDVAAHLTRQLRGMVFAFDAHNDALGVDRIDDAVAAGEDDCPRVTSSDAFHSSTHDRRLRAEQGHRLTLHVRAHQRAVGVVVFEERNERSGDRNKLFRADVDVVHFLAADQNEVAGLAGVDQLSHDAAFVVEFHVGLRDGVAIFLPSREVEGERFDRRRLLALLFQLVVDLLDFVLLDVIANFEIAVANVDDGDVVDHASTLDLAIGRFDEAVVVDAGIAAQRRDQSDVRTFWRLNRANAPVVRGVNVAHFESGALTRQAARPKCRETPLVRDLGERVGLIHELRQLGRSEKLADRGHHRLGVDQVVRHRRRHFLVHAHLLFDGAFHADQADAELVLHQLADRAHAPVAEVIDVVDRADVLTQLQQVRDGCVEIVRIEGALVETGGFLVLEQFDVELQTAHAGKVILARVEEHAVEQRRGRIERRRIAGTQLAVDFDQRFLRRLHRIALQGLADHRAHIVALGEEQAHLDHAGIENLRNLVGRELGVGFEHDFAGGGVDDVAGSPRAFEVADVNFDFGDLRLLNILQNLGIDLAAGVRDFVSRLVLDAVRELHAQQVRRLLAGRIERPVKFLVANHEAVHGVERAQNVFAGSQAQGAQENRAQELALAVDADIEHVLLVVFEFHPRTAIGNDLSEEIRAVVGGLEEHAWRTVQLADDDALGTVDDEGAVLRHQRNVAKENFLLLNIANRTITGLGVLVENRQTHGDFERRGISHAALFALRHVILQLQSHRVAALVAEVGRVGVVGPALAAQHFTGMERVGDDRGSAILTSGAQVVQPFEVAALALPVSNRVIHKLQL